MSPKTPYSILTCFKVGAKEETQQVALFTKQNKTQGEGQHGGVVKKEPARPCEHPDNAFLAQYLGYGHLDLDGV